MQFNPFCKVLSNSGMGSVERAGVWWGLVRVGGGRARTQIFPTLQYCPGLKFIPATCSSSW